MGSVKRNPCEKQYLDAIFQGFVQHLEEILIDLVVISVPKHGPHLSYDAALLFLDQIRVTMPRLAVIIQLVHFSLHPERTPIPFGNCFLNTPQNLKQRKDSFTIYTFRHEC